MGPLSGAPPLPPNPQLPGSPLGTAWSAWGCGPLSDLTCHLVRRVSNPPPQQRDAGQPTHFLIFPYIFLK